MIRAWLVVGCLLLAALPAGAQSEKWEAYGGYQFTKFAVPWTNFQVNGNGWDAALSYNISDWLAGKVDVSASYSSGATQFATVTTGPLNLYTYTFGPTFSPPGRQVKPFVEFLAGGYRDYNQYYGSSPAQGLALMAGGGVDVQGGRHLAWRFEADWLGFMSGTTHLYYGNKKNFRFSTGVVIRF